MWEVFLPHPVKLQDEVNYLVCDSDALAKEGVSVVRGRGGNRRTAGDDNPWGEHNAILQLFDDSDAGPSLSTLARADEGEVCSPILDSTSPLTVALFPHRHRV